MTGLSGKRQTPAPPKLNRDSFEFDNPHVEHVEVTQAPEASTKVESKGSGRLSPRATGPPNITSPPRVLANARATLQKLTKSPGSKQPENRRRSPTSHQPPPTVPATQKTHGASHSSSTNPPTTLPYGIHFDPTCMTLRIGYGYNNLAPRWLLKPTKKSEEKPDLAELEWVFDAGPFAYAMNSENSWLRKYAYGVLETTLENPVFRHNIRTDIWSRTDGNFQEIEDPIPSLPSPPPNVDVTRQDQGPTPGSWDGRVFKFPNYERPSLADRALPKAGSLYQNNRTPPRRIPRLYAESDEEGANSTSSTSIESEESSSPGDDGRDLKDTSLSRSESIEEGSQRRYQDPAVSSGRASAIRGDVNEVDRGTRVMDWCQKQELYTSVPSEDDASEMCRKLGIPDMQQRWLHEHSARNRSFWVFSLLATYCHMLCLREEEQRRESNVHDLGDFGQYKEINPAKKEINPAKKKRIRRLREKTGKVLKKFGSLSKRRNRKSIQDS